MSYREYNDRFNRFFFFKKRWADNEYPLETEAQLAIWEEEYHKLARFSNRMLGYLIHLEQESES